MGFFEYIFQQIFINALGNNIYYLLRKLIGDKRSYREIQDQTQGFIKFWTGSFTAIVITIFLVKCTS
ncbi:hypothetical protein CMU59_17530 [Elizabethkingia anophelis]|nr:hypothetical protein [Elizabethkingia anophelis]MDV3542254.1 hypothetical protein [Elizabethkingia anophelis]MDV3575095.1 hypothetical protein [Elizabethkingia anophelis]MDV3599386.1 hypothetical protein [Elizabethkingia anophelis]MDV3607050.1 hypothetical protein [Elizabethkingia anophelis]